MSVTRQVPARGGSSGGGPAAGQDAKYVMPFDAFLRWLSVGAKVRNDTAWLAWYEEWLKNMPEEDDGREEYMEKSKADYEARMGMTVGEYMDRMHKETLDEITDEITDECTRRNIEDATNHQIMVGNFEMFRREYIDMTARRSC